MYQEYTLKESLKEPHQDYTLKESLKEPQENLQGRRAMGAFPAVALAPVALTPLAQGWRSECNIEGLDVQATNRIV